MLLTLVVGMGVALLMQRVSPWVKALINIVLVASWAMPVVVAITILGYAARTASIPSTRPVSRKPCASGSGSIPTVSACR